MFRARVLLAVLLFASAAVSAQEKSGLAGDWSSCEALKEACAAEPDAMAIYDAAYLWAPGASMIGTCYVHDERTCPGCACPAYLKLSYLPNPKGWDGGTGCMVSKADAAAKLKQLCMEGACCCPHVETRPCANPAPVRARDPLTGSCCTFPNICSKPSDWITPVSSAECP